METKCTIETYKKMNYQISACLSKEIISPSVKHSGQCYVFHLLSEKTLIKIHSFTASTTSWKKCKSIWTFSYKFINPRIKACLARQKAHYQSPLHERCITPTFYLNFLAGSILIAIEQKNSKYTRLTEYVPPHSHHVVKTLADTISIEKLFTSLPRARNLTQGYP